MYGGRWGWMRQVLLRINGEWRSAMTSRDLTVLDVEEAMLLAWTVTDDTYWWGLRKWLEGLDV